MEDVSQFGECTLIKKYFKKRPPKHKILVDIGAKGKNGSNSFNFLVEGWKGILVEPSNKNFAVVERDFAGLNVTLVKAAIANYNGEGTLYIHKEPAHNSLLATHRPDTATTKTQSCQIKTLQKLFKEYKIPKDFDLLSIDIEGLDWKVFQQLLQSKFRPKVIVIEKRTVETTEIPDYHKIGETHANLIFVTDPL